MKATQATNKTKRIEKIFGNVLLALVFIMSAGLAAAHATGSMIALDVALSTIPAGAVLYVLTGMQWAGYLALFIAWILFVAGVASASKEATRR